MNNSNSDPMPWHGCRSFWPYGFWNAQIPPSIWKLNSHSWSNTAGSWKTLPKYYIIFVTNNNQYVNELDGCFIYQYLKSVTYNYAATGWGSNNLLNGAVEFNYALGCIVCVDSNVNLISLILSTAYADPLYNFCWTKL